MLEVVGLNLTNLTNDFSPS